MPLSAIINREIDDQGEEDFWVMVTTRSKKSSRDFRTLYGLRPALEERHRPIESFGDLTDFHSSSSALVHKQVMFVALLRVIKEHLYLQERAELNRVTRPRLLQMLAHTLTVIMVYYQRHFSRLTISEYSEIMLTVTGKVKGPTR